VRRTILLLSTMTIAVLAVSGAMLFGMGEPAQAQSVPEPPCNNSFCIDKTANPSPATVGQPITFTITQRCVGSVSAICFSGNTLVDEVPSGLTIDSVEYTGVILDPLTGLPDPSIECTTSGNTVTCPGVRRYTPTQPFTLTIVANPTECGTFTNTASSGLISGKVTFTVVQCPPPTKEECKNGGWEEFGFPDQGTCVSAWNRQNRQ
jgi:uncharacterized repeat protein (TIGR01451 family)